MKKAEFLKYIDAQIQWHDRKAVQLKKRRSFARTTIIVLSALISLLAILGSNFLAMQKTALIVTAVLANLTTVIESGIQINQYELWAQYRQTSQKLELEKKLFLTKTSHYSEAKTDQSFSKFAEKCKQILSETNKQWLESSTFSTSGEG